MTLSEMLDSLDAVVRMVSASLQSKDAVALEQSSTRLRDAMAAFSELARRFSSADWTQELRERAQALGEQMAMQRDQLARMAVVAQHQAAALIPQASDQATYGRDLYGNPHAGPGKARIYHSAS
ncbi:MULTISPECIES: hypothetical protein [Delftia]|uniref:hypothetical protein n=1 Tax=Delftia TaxID=80865 RepID=UPI001BAF2C0F|nr:MULTISPECIES: hypothetical protein [Delftia]MBS3724504.1 hypothetical protein [Delftia sp. PE138]MCO5339430.1 hypothetical protein [Delftia tsuruhatensis]MCR4547052.1 hypothetical protein [Delftia tsuruhatensis]